MNSAGQEEGSLRNRAVRASTWSVGGFVTAQVLRLVSSLVLTRLLTPDLFGLMAITMIVQTIFGLLSDVGLRQAVIQNPRGTQATFLDTVWVLQIVRGAIIWVFSSLTGVVIFVLGTMSMLRPDSVYADPLLPLLLFVTGAVTFVDSFHSTKVLVEQRKMALKGVTLIDLGSQMGGLVVTLLLALHNPNIWAILAGGLASAILHVWFTHAFLPGHRDRLQLDRETAREIAIFGRWIVISSSLSVFAANADRMLLGSWVTPEVLGFYAIAFSLLSVVIGAGDKLLGSIAFPMLSEAAREGGDRFRRLYSRLRLPSDLAFIGASGLLFGSAEWIVKLLFDPRYVAAGGMLKILSLSLILSRYGLAQSAYLAQGRTSYLSAQSAVFLVSTWIIIPVAFHFFGLQGALIAIAFRGLPTLPLIYTFNARLHINNWWVEFGALLAWPVGYGLGRAVTALGGWVR
jgi:O-antigen/teichoic acid export membrane protein